MFKAHLQNNSKINKKTLDADNGLFSQQEHRRDVSFFLLFGNRMTILMENTGEQLTA